MPDSTQMPDPVARPAPDDPTGAYPGTPGVAGAGGRLGGFKLVRELGRGGMGIVYEAEDTDLHRRVAVKCLLPDLTDTAFRQRFVREARAAAALRDDHVVTVHQVSQDGDTPFLVMEFLEGETLAARLERRGVLPAADAVRVAREVALGLAAAHAKGLIHRDVKPENVWLQAANGRAKVLDFGLARTVADNPLTNPGTVGYMAPEQIYGGPLDGRTDLYALGCLLYRMVWGDLPHRDPNTLALLDKVVNQDAPELSAVARKLPAPLAELLRRLLARNPADRPESATAVATELTAIGTALDPTAAAPAPAAPPYRWGQSSGVWIGVGAIVLAVAAGAASLADRFGRGTPTPTNPGGPAFVGEPVKVGVLHSSSGMFQGNETPMWEAILLAADEINAAGGVLGRKVEPVAADPRSTEDEYARLAEKLVTADGVSVVFGCWTTASRKRVAEVCRRHNNLLVYSVLGEGLEEHPNVVYAGGAPNQQLHEAVMYFRASTGPRKQRFFLVGSGYDLYSYAAHEMLADEIKNLGGAVVGDTYVPLGEMDFGEVVREIKEKKADVILNTVDGLSNLGFAAALKAGGVTPKEVPTVWIGIGEDELGALDLTDRVGDYAIAPYFESLDTPANKLFVRRFRDAFPTRRRISDTTAAAYSAVHLWAQAAKKAGTVDPVAVREGFRGQTFAAPEGPVRIDPATLYAWRATMAARMEPDGDGRPVFAVVDPPGSPIRPLPYPPPHANDKARWDAFALKLFKEWGNSWTKRDYGPGTKP